MSKIPVGIQLYTLREDCAKDFRATIRAVAEIGYQGVELAGDGGLSTKEMKMLLEENNLEAAGSHHGIDQLEGSLDQVIDYNLRIGNSRIVCPYLPQEFQDKGADGYRDAARILDKVGARLRERGLSLSYHNHSFEFSGKENGQYYLDLLLSLAAPENLLAELDTYWVQHGGESPVGYLNRYAGRVALLHIKDMAGDANRSFAEIGSGILDWDGIFAAAEKAGVKWLLVEQDICPGPPIESARKSFDYLASRGLVEGRGW
ncbi:MAG: Inosose dehydratase [bacterium]|nr:Inosose dehydratase [bacterium]